MPISSDTPKADIIVAKLKEVCAAQASQTKALVTIESRIALIHEEIRRTAETVTRLKLMADNAKRMALTQAKTLEALEARIAPGPDRE